jgi:hypothetical protein
MNNSFAYERQMRNVITFNFDIHTFLSLGELLWDPFGFWIVMKNPSSIISDDTNDEIFIF